MTPAAIEDTLVRLAGFTPSPMPVISLYLNTQPDQHGRARFDPFVRKETKAAESRFEPRSPERESLERDTERIRHWLAQELRPSSNGAALFACSAAGLFEAMQFDAPVEQHRLYLGSRPRLFGLARLRDQYPRCAVLLADTSLGRLFTFGLGAKLLEDRVETVKIRDIADPGRWSRAKEDSRIENHRQRHAAEMVARLEEIVRSEKIEQVVLAGDEVVFSVLRPQLSPALAERVIAELALDIRTPEHEVRSAAQRAQREYDARHDLERIEAMFEALGAGGLAIAGRRGVLAALEQGRVSEMFLFAGMDADGGFDPDDFVGPALRTGARLTFIENPDLLRAHEGVAAALRFKL